MNDRSADTARQEFDLHIAVLTDTQKALVEATAKVAGFLLLALGWLATSEQARTYLARDKPAAIVFALAMVVAYLISAFLTWLAYRACAKTYSHLQSLAHLPERAYEVRKPWLLMSAGYMLGTGVLALALVIVLLRL
jgi:hypothetical protein